MSEKLERLKADLASLSLEDREGIREYLDGIEEEEPSQEEWDEYLIELVSRRTADLEAGRTTLISWEEVNREMREKYG
jgi:hypothetical protein